MRFTLIVLAAFLCLSPTTADAAGEAKIGVVDMATLIQNHPSAKELDVRYESAKEKAKLNWDATQERLREMLGKIKQMDPNDPDRRLKERAYEQQKVSAEFSRRWAEREAVTEYVRSLERIFKDVMRHVRTHARENGIQLVLQRETEPGKIVSASLDDFFVKLRLRTVLYNADELDITKAVQARIDKDSK